jgi:16S rRNA (adenine1518-N6/adenine1519-N6)-dimethyltransferase
VDDAKTVPGTPAPGVDEAKTVPVTPVPGVKLWVAGNLPYTITTPLLLWCYDHASYMEGAVFMVQREYGDRLLAEVGTREYSSITVWTRAHAVVRSLLRVGRSSFWPRPGVESVVLELRFPDPAPFRGDRGLLEKILRAAFGQRRKMLQNTLAAGLDIDKSEAVELLHAAGCDPSARAETLDLEHFSRLVDVWSQDPRSR